jgi:NodT family efflux transporter outer membrane factor (OMF) lipoprotein
MRTQIKPKHIAIALVMVLGAACKVPQITEKATKEDLPVGYTAQKSDTANMVATQWRTYFADPALTMLIDSALQHNQELNILLQEIEISRNEIRARKGEYLPFVNLQSGIGYEKAGQYTRDGAVEEGLEIKPGKAFPKPLGDYRIAAVASWELDVWNKLHNATKAAALRYLATIEGRNFMVTHLIAEIAESYYELMALDNQLLIVQQNIELQDNALKIVRQQKEAAKVTQLAVNRFEAQLLNTRNLQFEISQRITETENRIRFLTGSYNTAIPRNPALFNDMQLEEMKTGVPSQLLVNRPDIRQAELELEAARIDIKVARASFYPSFRIQAGIGFQAFNPVYLIKPESILYNLAGDMMAPLVNRNAITAAFNNASAQQVQAVYKYEQSILNAYTEVLNQLAKADNFGRSHSMKEKEVAILLQSVNISNNLFNSARADYMEVLLTQREALESKMQLIEIRMKQLSAKVNIYKSLGGGWNQ